MLILDCPLSSLLDQYCVDKKSTKVTQMFIISYKIATVFSYDVGTERRQLT